MVAYGRWLLTRGGRTWTFDEDVIITEHSIVLHRA